ncbi:hypothetical protein A9Q89_04825 [Gammaproteobacteria bacterium 53_120_T64]|nr:hypothetical protein A9Q89_04825 [Gammaproteobacteria bacterium 53_120_T64]
MASHEGGDVYSISIAAGSGITGLNLTGTQDGAGGQFSFTLLNDNGSPAGGTVGAFGGDVSGAFAVTAGNSYTLRYLGDNVTAYGLTLTAVPIPAAAWLFGSVLMALGVVGRKRRLGQVDQVAVPA